MDINNYSYINYSANSSIIQSIENDNFCLYIEKKINYFSEIYFIVYGYSYKNELDFYENFEINELKQTKQFFFDCLKQLEKVA